MESTDAILERFLSALPLAWCASAREALGLRGGGGLFSHALTCWLMVLQRLEGLSVEGAWLSVSPELARRLAPASKRALEGRLSGWAGGHGHARVSLPLRMAEAVADRVFAELSRVSPSEAGAFLLDGTSLSPDGSAALRAAYPPCRTARAASHFPCLRAVVAHELSTGLALRPAWGPMYGEGATSEQALALGLAARLPAGSTVVGDRNFGVFWVAHGLAQAGCVGLLRLTDVRARSLAGKGTDLSFDRELDLVWRASRAERARHPELAEGAQVAGRLIVRHVRPPGEPRVVRLLLFESGEPAREPDESARLYARRWDVETDLRTLKQTLGLARPRARLPEVLAKELVLGVCAYNLVRALGARAAERAGAPPRRMSFARVAACARAYAPRLAAAQEPEERERLVDEMLERAATRTLLARDRKHPPREAWNRSPRFPTRKPKPHENPEEN